jgi:hypothetical protein
MQIGRVGVLNCSRWSSATVRRLLSVVRSNLSQIITIRPAILHISFQYVVLASWPSCGQVVIVNQPFLLPTSLSWPQHRYVTRIVTSANIPLINLFLATSDHFFHLVCPSFTAELPFGSPTFIFSTERVVQAIIGCRVILDIRQQTTNRTQWVDKAPSPPLVMHPRPPPLMDGSTDAQTLYVQTTGEASI